MEVQISVAVFRLSLASDVSLDPGLAEHLRKYFNLNMCLVPDHICKGFYSVTVLL